jgi:hypothetical protein
VIGLHEGEVAGAPARPPEYLRACHPADQFAEETRADLLNLAQALRQAADLDRDDEPGSG